MEVGEDYLKGTQLAEWYPRSPTEVHSQELSIIHKVGFLIFLVIFLDDINFLISFFSFFILLL